MSMILDRIAADKRLEIEQLKFDRSETQLKREVANLPPTEHRLRGALTSDQPVHIIAELKRGSPSKGIIRPDFDVIALTESFAQGGASAVSVLTDRKHFYGSFENLEEAAATAPELPRLCKDFLIDPYQIYFARAHGADAVLLIVRLLPPELLADMIGLAEDLGLDALVEVHTESEAAVATGAGAKIVGVNSRDLGDFSVDLARAERIAASLPAGVVRVAESGIETRSDIERLRASGFDSFLVGEALMRCDDPGSKLKEFLAL